MKNRTTSPLNRTWNSQNGFSLVEMLVALAILALIAGVAGPKAISLLGRSKTKTAELQIQELITSVELFYLDVGRYPNETENLKVLVTNNTSNDGWNGPYLANPDSLNDPWNRPYLYRYPGTRGEFDIYTLGRDGVEGGGGEDRDIVK